MRKILYLLALFSGAAIFNTFSICADGFPQYTRTDYPTNGGAMFMHVGTENSDTYPDLIVISEQGVINVLLGGPNAIFGTAIVTITGIPIRSHGSFLEKCVADDFNNDGLTDICIKDTLFVATGDGLFAPPKSLGIENLQTNASADMNGDGNKDFIAIAIIYTSPTMRAAEIQTHFGNGDGTFQEPVKTRIVFGDDDSGMYSIPYIGDLTGDGIPDLLVSHYYVYGINITSLCRTYTGSSSGTFIAHPAFSNYGLNIQNIAVHDFTGDGIVDIFCGGHYFSLYAGDNTGNFTSLWEKQFDDGTFEGESRVFTSVDVNGDGIFDAAIIRQWGTFDKAFDKDYCILAAMLGNSDGSYGDIHEFSVELPLNYLGYGYPEYPGLGSIMACNLNDDGCADFIIPCTATTDIAVILSTLSVSVNKSDEINCPALFQNTPNPFNASTTIPYSINRPGTYELSVYDINGQKVATLVNGQMSAGKHSVTFDGSRLASGVYLYRFESAGLNKTGKMLLLK